MIEACGKSVCGPARRNNEDYYGYRAVGNYMLLAVGDGLGGCPYGEIASRIAVETALNYMTDMVPGILEETELSVQLDKAFNRANIAILRDCAEQPEHIGMCSTLTMAVIKGTRVTIAHYGDCRAYLIHDDDILQLTEDHNVTGFLLRSGKITEEEARLHEGRNELVNSLGENKFIRPDIYTYNANYGDCVILASDGMYSLFDEDACRDILQNKDDPELLCELLATRGASDESRDNSTVVVARIKDE